MARPIKETPVLRGKDAEMFRWYMEHPNPASRERIERARATYEYFKRNSPDCSMFKRIALILILLT